MIHRIEVDASTEVVQLKKQFRKCLMTGGAVIRIASGVEGVDLENIAEKFLPEAHPHNLASMVLEEVAKNSKLSVELRAKLIETGLDSVIKALG